MGAVSGCAALLHRAPELPPQPLTIPYEEISGMITVPVRLNGSVDSRFIVDTGMGLNVISASMAKRLPCSGSGHYTGKRMSGQAVTLPLSTVGSVALGDVVQKHVPVGILDLGGMPPELAQVGGFLSLTYFERTPFTIDYPGHRLIIETAASLQDRVHTGRAVPLRLAQDRSTLTAFLHLEAPNGVTAESEIDTGSGAVIFDEAYMPRLGLAATSGAVHRQDAVDETGHAYTRYFAQLAAPIHAAGAPEYRQTGLPAMFQRIIYDGLVGNAYFQPYQVTFDLVNQRLILNQP
jgi:hypothetical protein